MSGGRSFLDTNVCVYAVDESPEEAAKHAVAAGILQADPDDLVVSTQVLQELYVTVTRKLRRPLSEERAARAVAGLARLDVVVIEVPMVLAAVETSRTSRISLWDALVVEAARAAGCERVLTEDLADGEVLRGVAIENPFRQQPLPRPRLQP
ncbi:MAG: PIN domain-containing protein [Acidimicrobiales bacterium]